MARQQFAWFRLYADARSDKKLATLTLAERGVWLNLLCYASEQEERGSFDASDRFILALECADGDEEILDNTITKLLRVRHLEDDGSGLFHFRDLGHIAALDSRESATLHPVRIAWQALTHKLRPLILDRDNYTCQACGRRDGPLEIDHIVPIARGGTNDTRNLRVLCLPCNRRKGARA